MNSNRQLSAYYSRRALEYEAIYGPPERQRDLRELEAQLAALCRASQLLEIACGTGYWTQRLSRAAASIIATDISVSVLRVARQKRYSCSTHFAIADAFAPQPFRRPFNAVVAGFWWSHIALDRIAGALSVLQLSAAPNARLLIFDNRFVPGSSSPIAATDTQGNTYQQRTLADGSRHMVLKNYPSMPDVLSRLHDAGASDLQPVQLTHYWLTSCRLRPAA